MAAILFQYLPLVSLGCQTSEDVCSFGHVRFQMKTLVPPERHFVHPSYPTKKLDYSECDPEGESTLDVGFMRNPKWIATLEALQEKRALRYLEQEAGIPPAFFDSATNKPDPNP